MWGCGRPARSAEAWLAGSPAGPVISVLARSALLGCFGWLARRRNFRDRAGGHAGISLSGASCGQKRPCAIVRV